MSFYEVHECRCECGGREKVDGDSFNTYYAGKFDDTEKKNLCGAVQVTIKKYPAAIGQSLGSAEMKRISVVSMRETQGRAAQGATHTLASKISDYQRRHGCGPGSRRQRLPRLW